MNNEANILRSKAELNAVSAINATNRTEAYKLWDLAWDLSEQAYDLDGRKEPMRHEEFMSRMGKNVVRMHGERVQAL